MQPCHTIWQQRTKVWRRRKNLRTGSERLRGGGPPVGVAPPPTDAKVIAGAILGYRRRWAIGDIGDERGQEIKWRSQICRGETRRRARLSISLLCALWTY